MKMEDTPPHAAPELPQPPGGLHHLPACHTLPLAPPHFPAVSAPALPVFRPRPLPKVLRPGPAPRPFFLSESARARFSADVGIL